MVKKIGRHYFYYVKCLETGKTVSHNADKVCESASTIKVAILVFLLSEVEKGKLSLRQPVRLKKEHYSHLGSGILHNFYRTRPFILHDLALMMIIISDNIATNALIELLDKEKINKYLSRIGLTNTRLIMSCLTFPDNYSIKNERIGETTPHEMAMLVERALSGELLNSTHTKLVRKFMSKTQNSFFGRLLPSARNMPNKTKITSFGNKTGSCYYDVENQQVINDCGFFKTTKLQNYIFSVFSRGDAGNRMQYAVDSFPRTDFANVSKEILQEIT